MAIPHFNADGLLPPGVHECTLAEAKDRFAFNDTREAIWENLLVALQEMRTATLTGIVHLDGSYVTDKAIPEDVDLILDVRNEPLPQQGLAILFFHMKHNLLKQNNVDWWPTLPAQNDFVTFFQYLGEKTAAAKQLQPKDLKGILRVTSWNP